ncbi:MAG: 2Fe-2S iron-sulfur cluster binding domain-containing protein [Candidatus Cloacimonetes bacterium]|nr:2Fe-2S iron-sulfur cluster binding domain-containing protein [Candidatus Cloacimonadota bacterium]
MKHIVKFINTNESFEIKESEYMLDALQAHKLDLPFSCGSGVCGACVMQVSGEVKWMSPNHCLSPGEVEDGFILPCICKAKESIEVLD